MTTGEEASKVATSAIDALKGNPGLLALILLQVATMLALIYVAKTNNEHRQARELMMLDRCLADEKTL